MTGRHPNTQIIRAELPFTLLINDEVEMHVCPSRLNLNFTI